MFDTAMTPRQLEYLRRTHEPLIAKHGITQHHYDVMLQYLTDAMRSNEAQVGELALSLQACNWAQADMEAMQSICTRVTACALVLQRSRY
jgi:hypothetical protein